MRGRRPWLVLAGAVLTLVVGAAPAAAHDVLRSTNPPDGAQLHRMPSEVVLTFDQPALAMGTQVVVTGPSGPVQVGRPRLVDETVTQDVQPGAPPGSYTVSWRVTSADGHPVSGTFAFSAREASEGRTARPVDAPASSTPDPAGRRLALLIGVPVAVLAVGVVVLLARRRRPD